MTLLQRMRQLDCTSVAATAAYMSVGYKIKSSMYWDNIKRLWLGSFP